MSHYFGTTWDIIGVTQMIKVSKVYLNEYGHEMVKASIEGQFEDVELDLMDGKLTTINPESVGHSGYTKEFYGLMDTLTVVHNNNQHVRTVKKRVRLAKVQYDKNPWYTRNDRLTVSVLNTLSDFVVDFLIDFIDNNPRNKLLSYYSSLLIKVQTSKPSWRALPLEKSNQLPFYNETTGELIGSQNAMLYLIRTVYSEIRGKKVKMKVSA